VIVFYFALAAAVVFIVPQLFAPRSEIRRSDATFSWIQPDGVCDEPEDLLAIELGARIFNAEDSRLINAETPPNFVRWFQSERKALALGWLREVRGRVREIVRDHRVAASKNRHVRPLGEMRIAFQFLIFEVMSGILYLLICVRGPSHASNVVRSVLDWAAQLRTLAHEVIGETRPAVEIVKD
jgi:hypothetical protein